MAFLRDVDGLASRKSINVELRLDGDDYDDGFAVTISKIEIATRVLQKLGHSGVRNSNQSWREDAELEFGTPL